LILRFRGAVGRFHATLKYKIEDSTPIRARVKRGNPATTNDLMGGINTMKETMRCKNCGEDWAGVVCVHCGCDDFVDVAAFYDKEVLQHYRQQRQAVEL
jgi:hypothetical protein